MVEDEGVRDRRTKALGTEGQNADEIKQGAFDGTILWSTNFHTMEPEISDAETTANVKLDANDFPDALLNYQRKGYMAELVGKERISGIEAFKIKLTKEPITIDQQKFDDICYSYFDSNAFLKHGPIEGATMVIILSDYRAVQGLLFPFTMSQGVKDAPPQPLTVESIEINPRISNKEFSYPGK